MATLDSFKDNGMACFANIRMGSGEPVYISVARSGVVVKKSRLGILGKKLYVSKNLNDASNTASILNMAFPDSFALTGMSDPMLRAFSNAVLHCDSASEVEKIIGEASK